MENCEGLAWYGAFVLLLAGAFVVIPYYRRKAELISGWSFFLAGVGIFVGIGCFEAATTPMRFPGLDWFKPTKAEVNRFLALTTVFLIALVASYYYDPISRRVAARTFNKWPPLTTPMMLFVIAGSLVLVAASQVNALLHIPFVGQVLMNVSHKAFIFATMFSCVLWYRNRMNFTWLGLFVVVFLTSCVLAMVAGAGRRLLLCVLMVPVIVVYYYHARHWRPTKSMVVIAAGMLLLFVLELMYSSFRHFDRRGAKLDRTAANVVQQVKDIGSRNWYERFAREKLWHFSQQVVHYAMITDRFISRGSLQTKPLNTFKFFLVYPVPRYYYPDKPIPLGRHITRTFLGRSTSWGTGVAGQSRYEGGLIVAAMFGYFAAFGIRFFVDPLQRQPTNPFLLAMLAAGSLQLLAWPRGDLGVMTFETVESIFYTLALAIACRVVFGTAPTQHAAQQVPARYSYMYRVPAR
jgi:hypothetical protein